MKLLFRRLYKLGEDLTVVGSFSPDAEKLGMNDDASVQKVESVY
jgi:hypothetical protein